MPPDRPPHAASHSRGTEGESPQGSAGAGQQPGLQGPTVSEEIDRLFREHNAALLRFIAAKLGSTHEAKEVAQEAYVRLLNLDRRQAVSYLRAFLFKTAANLALDRLRQRARRGFMTSTHNLDVAVFDLSPERQIEGEQAMQRLSAAIDELPRKCREAFLLYRLDGLSCQEVARRMGLQERMVWLYVARALEYLRARVNGETPEPERDGQEHTEQSRTDDRTQKGVRKRVDQGVKR